MRLILEIPPVNASECVVIYACFVAAATHDARVDGLNLNIATAFASFSSQHGKRLSGFFSGDK